MKRAVAVAVLILAFAASSSYAWASPTRTLPSQAVRPAAASKTRASSESIGVLVQFKQPAAAGLSAKLIAGATDTSASVLDARHGLYSFSSSKTANDKQYAAQLMLAAPGIHYAEPNYVRHVAAYTAPTDPDFNDSTTWIAYGTDYYPSGKHWWLSAIKAPGAWQIGQGVTYPAHGTASDVKIAVLDTGIYLSHPDLNGGTVVAGKDEFASYNPNTGVFTTDFDITPTVQSDLGEASHGTGVAAAAGGEVNGVGMVGSGWNPTIVGYKVEGPITASWGTDPAGTVLILDGAVAQAIYDATDAGCKVINMSLAGPDYSSAYTAAINYAHSKNVVVVCAVGNEGDNTTVNYPAACQYAVGVGATELSGSGSTPQRAFFSDYAPGVVDLAAPGETFWTADKPDWDSDGTGTVSVNGYQFESGTSFASPTTAGAIAYLWRAMPDLTNDQIVNYVESTAGDMGTAGRDDQYGYGIVDMQAAYNKLIADYPMLTKPTVSAPAYAGGHQGTISWNAVPGYNVSYRVSVDGALRTTTTSTSYVAASLADGSHTVTVMPASTRNWNTTTTPGSAAFVEDSVAPAVSGFAWDGTALSWSVSETNPYTVQAYVDAASPSTLPSNTLTPGALAGGNHTLNVRATDGAGNSSGWVSYVFNVAAPPAAPAVSSVVVTDALSATVTWPAVPSATSYDCQVGSGSIVSTSGPAFGLTGLGGGVTAVAVRAVNSVGASSWVTATVTDNVVAPAAPALSVPSSVGLPGFSASWPSAAFAKSYEYRLDDGSPSTTTGLIANFALTSAGAHEIGVRSRNNLSSSAWVTATVTYTVPAPSPSVPATVWAPSATVSWAPVPGATTYEYSVDGGATDATTTTSFVADGLDFGTHTIAVRTVQGSARSTWTTASVTYATPDTMPLPLPVPALALGVSSTRLAYPATALVLSASVSAGERSVRLQSSADGVNWGDLGSFISTATPGVVALPVSVVRSTYFRLVFDGDSEYAAAVSPAAFVTAVPRLAAPSAASRVRRSRRFTATTTARAQSANSASSVTFQFQRWQKSHGRYQWVTRKSVRARGTFLGGDSTRYRVTTSLSPAGKWRIVALYAGAPVYGSASSSARALTVR